MNSFIKKLIKKYKIKLTEPSNEVAKAYLQKSKKSLISSKYLIKIENYDDATALIYFSMYYSALALLFKFGIKSENHSGTSIILKEMCGIDNKEIQNAKKERVDKQYYVDFKATKEEVKKGIEIAEEFNANIKEKIDKLKEIEIKKIHLEFKKKYF